MLIIRTTKIPGGILFYSWYRSFSDSKVPWYFLTLPNRYWSEIWSRVRIWRVGRHTPTTNYKQLLVFIVTPFKIDQNENQNRWTDKSRIWKMKGGKYTKTLAKIWVEEIIRIRDIRGKVLPKSIELCMETPCWSSSGWAPTWRTETSRKICYRVLVQKRELTPKGTHKH